MTRPRAKKTAHVAPPRRERLALFAQNRLERPHLLACGQVISKLLAYDAGARFDRWWVVRCTKADEGRAIIFPNGWTNTAVVKDARIIASGTRHA